MSFTVLTLRSPTMSQDSFQPLVHRLTAGTKKALRLISQTISILLACSSLALHQVWTEQILNRTLQVFQISHPAIVLQCMNAIPSIPDLICGVNLETCGEGKGGTSTAQDQVSPLTQVIGVEAAPVISSLPSKSALIVGSTPNNAQTTQPY